MGAFESREAHTLVGIKKKKASEEHVTVDARKFLTFIKQKIAEGWTMSQKCSHDPIAVMDYYRMGPESRVQSWLSPVWSLNPDIESILNQATFFVCLFIFIIMFKNIFLLFYSRKKCA